MTKPPTSSASSANACSARLRIRPNDPIWSRWSARKSSPVSAVKPSGVTAETSSSRSSGLEDPRTKKSAYSWRPSLSQSNALASGTDTVPPESMAPESPNVVMPTMVAFSLPARVSTVTLSPTAKPSSSARFLSTAISPAPDGASPEVRFSGFSSSSAIHSRPVAFLAKGFPSSPRKATGPVSVPAPASTPSRPRILSAVAPEISSGSLDWVSVWLSSRTTATSTLPNWRSTSPSSVSMTRSEMKPVAA